MKIILPSGRVLTKEELEDTVIQSTIVKLMNHEISKVKAIPVIETRLTELRGESNGS